jgi:CubicO group peptidase (beta-lactamase class C family)
LGLIAEVVTQKPFQDFMASDIFRPLGMNSSLLYQRGLNAISNRAYGHEMRDGKWVRSDQSLTSAVRGDGGVYTSLRDYQKWLVGIDGQKLLSAESYDAMFKPQVKADRQGCHYGYGWFIDEYRGEPRIFHNGDTHGFRMCVQRFPKKAAAILVQLNGEVAGEPDGMTKIGEQIADTLIFGNEHAIGKNR